MHTCGGAKSDAVHARALALTSTHVLRRVRAYRGMHTCGGAKSDAVHARALAVTGTHVLRRVRAYRGMHTCGGARGDAVKGALSVALGHTYHLECVHIGGCTLVVEQE